MHTNGNHDAGENRESAAASEVELVDRLTGLLFEDCPWLCGDEEFMAETLKHEISRREREGDISAGVVAADALSRYFQAIQAAKESLSGYFTKDEFLPLLNIVPATRWDRVEAQCPATAVYLDAGLDELEPEDVADSPQFAFLIKLAALSTIQRFALADSLELMWRRGPRSGGLEEMMATFEIRLSN